MLTYPLVDAIPTDEPTAFALLVLRYVRILPMANPRLGESRLREPVQGKPTNPLWVHQLSLQDEVAVLLVLLPARAAAPPANFVIAVRRYNRRGCSLRSLAEFP